MEQQVEGRNEKWPCAILVDKQESLIQPVVGFFAFYLLEGVAITETK